MSSATSSVYDASSDVSPLATHPSSPATALTSLNVSSEHLPSTSHQGGKEGFATRAIHVGSAANSETGAVIPPISLSTTYKQDAIGVHKVSYPSHLSTVSLSDYSSSVYLSSILFAVYLTIFHATVNLLEMTSARLDFDRPSLAYQFVQSSVPYCLAIRLIHHACHPCSVLSSSIPII